MSGKSGAGYRVDWSREAQDTGPHRQVALSHAECHRLLAAWGAVEAAAVRKVWYPPASAGYADYEPPRDPEARLEREVRAAERDWVEISRTGWAVLSVQRPYRIALIAHYRDGEPIGRHKRGLALDAFGRKFLIFSEIVDGPLNSL